MASLGLENTVAALIEGRLPSKGEAFRLSILRFTKAPISIDALNHYWRVLIYRAPPNDTVLALESLCTSHDFGAWLANFENNVLPIVIRYRLLENIHE